MLFIRAVMSSSCQQCARDCIILTRVNKCFKKKKIKFSFQESRLTRYVIRKSFFMIAIQSSCWLKQFETTKIYKYLYANRVRVGFLLCASSNINGPINFKYIYIYQSIILKKSLKKKPLRRLRCVCIYNYRSSCLIAVKFILFWIKEQLFFFIFLLILLFVA